MGSNKCTESSSQGSSGPGGIRVVDAPTVVDVLPNGLLPAQFNFSDLRILIETPWAILPGNNRSQFVIFEWSVRGAKPTDTPAVELRGPLTDADFPLVMSIDKSYLLSSAVVDLRFRIHNTRPDSPSFDTSQTVTIRIDREAPGGGALLPPAIFPIDPLTEAYLNTNPTVPVEIPPHYLGREVGDHVLLYFSDMNLVPTGMPTLVSPRLTSDSGTIIVDVPSEVFRRYPGALWVFCFYRLQDLAGNVNPLFSEVAQVRLQVDLPPVLYPRPRFPQSESHPGRYMTCSTLPRIWFGVEVLIDPDPGILHGDLITLRFQGYRQFNGDDPDPNTVETLIHYWDGTADASGYLFRILDVERVIRPLKQNAGGVASYTVTRNGTIIGGSSLRSVQFDRVVPVSPQPPTPIYCWIDGNGPES